MLLNYIIFQLQMFSYFLWVIIFLFWSIFLIFLKFFNIPVKLVFCLLLNVILFNWLWIKIILNSKYCVHFANILKKIIIYCYNLHFYCWLARWRLFVSIVLWLFFKLFSAENIRFIRYLPCWINKKTTDIFFLI